jgi:hypothetical protein
VRNWAKLAIDRRSEIPAKFVTIATDFANEIPLQILPMKRSKIS